MGAKKQPQKENQLSPIELIQKLIRKGETWEKKDLLNAIYWMKLLVSLSMGLILGFVGISNGMFGNMTYIITIAIGFQFVISSVFQIDVESILGNGSSAITEGLVPTYAAFLLMWILAYNIKLSLSQ